MPVTHTVREVLLAVEAATLLSVIRVGLCVLPFRTLRRTLEHAPSRTAPSSHVPVERIVRVIAGVARRLPGRTTCLVDALAADVMLRRYGHASVIRFGVRPPGTGPRPLDAHAWIEHAGTVVLGRVEDLPEYRAGC